MRAIGGFFETERNLGGSEDCHQGALALSYGRASLRAILEWLRPRRVLVPFYTCDAVLQPLRLLKIPASFYALDASLSPREEFRLRDDECALVVDYFGLKRHPIAAAARRWGRQLLIDNTQAFYAGPLAGCFSFNSARKFFGVPDGSFLYGPDSLPLRLAENTDVRLDHMILRSAGDLAGAYEAFKAGEARISSEAKAMSQYSLSILRRIPHGPVGDRRRANYLQYDRALGDSNTLPAPLPPQAVPLCYPLLPKHRLDKRLLAERGVFVPTFWAEVAEREGEGFAAERRLAQDLLPLPVDHRYGPADIGSVIDIVKGLLKA